MPLCNLKVIVTSCAATTTKSHLQKLSHLTPTTSSCHSSHNNAYVQHQMYNLIEKDQFFFGTDTWVLDLVRTSTGGLVAISSDQKLSLFDPSSLSKGPVSSFQTGHGNISTLKVFGENVVCTAGENGTVEVWDLKAGKRVTQFQGELSIML